MLTEHDRTHGPPFLVVGTRSHDSATFVLEDAQTEEAAEQRANEFRQYLEGWERIDVERVADAADQPFTTGLGVGMDKVNRLNLLKERHQMLKTNKPESNGHGKEHAASQAAPAMTKFQRAEALREIIRPLGAEATYEQARAAAAAKGHELAEHQFKARRKELGWVTKRGPYKQKPLVGPKAPAAKAGGTQFPKPLPMPWEADGVSESRSEAARPSVSPPATTVHPVSTLESLATLAGIVRDLGGIGAARRAIDTLEAVKGLLT